MILGGRAPCRARVVHQNVDAAERGQRFIGEAGDFVLPRAVRRDPPRIDAARAQMLRGGIEFIRLARGQHDARALFAQCLGNLQAEAA